MEYQEILQRFQYEDDRDVCQRLANIEKADFQQNRDIINQIVLWKLNRSVNVSDDTLTELNSLEYLKSPLESLKDKKVKSLIGKLLSSKGIKLAVASAILHFYYPDIFPIIDQRSYRELYGEEFPVYSDKNKEEKYVTVYLQYVKDCYEYQQSNCPEVPFSYIDKVLYQIDKEKGNKVRY